MRFFPSWLVRLVARLFWYICTYLWLVKWFSVHIFFSLDFLAEHPKLINLTVKYTGILKFKLFASFIIERICYEWTFWRFFKCLNSFIFFFFLNWITKMNVGECKRNNDTECSRERSIFLLNFALNRNKQHTYRGHMKISGKRNKSLALLNHWISSNLRYFEHLFFVQTLLFADTTFTSVSMEESFSEYLGSSVGVFGFINVKMFFFDFKKYLQFKFLWNNALHDLESNVANIDSSSVTLDTNTIIYFLQQLAKQESMQKRNAQKIRG